MDGKWTSIKVAQTDINPADYSDVWTFQKQGIEDIK